jgi:hypothetical protein
MLVTPPVASLPPRTHLRVAVICLPLRRARDPASDRWLIRTHLLNLHLDLRRSSSAVVRKSAEYRAWPGVQAAESNISSLPWILPALQVVCSTVRYVWLVVVGLVGLVAGFLVGARLRLWPPWDASWTEAAGTWVSAGLSATILVWLASRSQKQARELETARQAREDELASRSEKQAKDLEATRQAREDEELSRRKTVEASQVICEAWSTDSYEEDGALFTRLIVVALNNHSEGVVTNLTCQVNLDGGIGPIELVGDIAAGKERQWDLPPLSEPIRHNKDDREVHAGVVFEFSLNGERWSRRQADAEAVRKQRALA